MTVSAFEFDDMIVMTPPCARNLAQQEAKRLVLLSTLMTALLGLCTLSAVHFSQVVSAKYALGVAAFLPQVF